jgi:hypothetical protein
MVLLVVQFMAAAEHLVTGSQQDLHHVVHGVRILSKAKVAVRLAIGCNVHEAVFID